MMWINIENICMDVLFTLHGALHKRIHCTMRCHTMTVNKLGGYLPAFRLLVFISLIQQFSNGKNQQICGGNGVTRWKLNYLPLIILCWTVNCGIKLSQIQFASYVCAFAATMYDEWVSFYANTQTQNRQWPYRKRKFAYKINIQITNGKRDMVGRCIVSHPLNIASQTMYFRNWW